MLTRTVQKNLSLEFPKMQGRFMLHFNKKTFQEPPISQGRIHGTELPELGFGHNF